LAYISVAQSIGVSSTTFTSSAQNAIEFKVTDFGSNRKLICDFLLVVNSNLPPILHGFRDIALERSKIAIFGYLSLV